MPDVDGFIFIDANQYLDLYRMVTSEDLLPGLEKLKDHILVTDRLVKEVLRNKLKITKSFLNDQLKKIRECKFVMPDHFFKGNDEPAKKAIKTFKETRSRIKDAERMFPSISDNFLYSVSRSEDEVSKTLSTLFSAAIPNDEGELNRAKSRKELGDPPGKSDDPLGDQLNWEQIKTYFQAKKLKRLWLITGDEDFYEEHNQKLYLNSSLYHDLAKICESAPEVRCFKLLEEGIKDFANRYKVGLESLPSPENSLFILMEQEGLSKIKAEEFLKSIFEKIDLSITTVTHSPSGTAIQELFEKLPEDPNIEALRKIAEKPKKD